MSTDNVIPFPARPDNFDWGDVVVYATLYDNGATFSMPDDVELDKPLIGNALFDASFSVLQETENSVALISIGNEVTKTYRRKNAFETPEERAWLARRLDDLYKNFTGRSRSPVRAFFKRHNPFSKGQSR